MRKLIALTAVLALALILLTACGGGGLVGTWSRKMDRNAAVTLISGADPENFDMSPYRFEIEFRGSGTCSATLYENDRAVEGTGFAGREYDYEDGELDIDGLLDDCICRIDGSTMTWQPKDPALNVVLTFTRK